MIKAKDNKRGKKLTWIIQAQGLIGLENLLWARVSLLGLKIYKGL